MNSVCKLSLVLTVAAIIAGCAPAKDKNQKETVPVTGTVNFKGKPLEGATVTFVQSNDPTPAYGKTDAEGKFKLTTYVDGDGAVVGSHTVLVTKTETKGGAVANADQNSKDYVPPDGSIAPTTIYLIPQKYSLPGASGLTADVKASDKNDFTFDLTE